MSRKQSASSALVVCDDAVSGSESDKDTADELRVSMEGVFTDTSHFMNSSLHTVLTLLQLLTSELRRSRTSMTRNCPQNSSALKIAGPKTWRLRRLIFSADSKAFRHACYVYKQYCHSRRHRALIFAYRASMNSTFALPIMKRTRHALLQKRALSRL